MILGKFHFSATIFHLSRPLSKVEFELLEDVQNLSYGKSRHGWRGIVKIHPEIHSPMVNEIDESNKSNESNKLF